MKLRQKLLQPFHSGNLPAVSLVETIIAMVIVTVSFAGGMILFLNIMKNEQISLRVEASIYAQNLLVQTKQEQRYVDETFAETGFQVVKTIKKYGSNAETYELNLISKDVQGKIIHELKEIIYIPATKKK